MDAKRVGPTVLRSRYQVAGSTSLEELEKVKNQRAGLAVGNNDGMGYEANFDGSWAKFHKAEQHAYVLKDSIGRLFSESNNQVAIAAIFEPKRSEYVVKVGGIPNQALEHFGLLIGDAIHNFRGALDHLVWQLALEHHEGRRPPDHRRIQFPILQRAADFKQRFPSLQVAAEHEPILARFQPYRGGHGKHLARLRDLSNEDKHQVLTPLVLLPQDYAPLWLQDFGKVTGTTVPERSGRLRLGSTVLRVALKPQRGTQPQPVVAGTLKPTVALKHWGHPVPVLANIGAAVGEVLATYLHHREAAPGDH